MSKWTKEVVTGNVVLTHRSVKHRGENVEDVADSDPNYLRWLLREQDLDTDDESAIEDALEDAGEPLELP
jgi:hypothetical protein